MAKITTIRKSLLYNMFLLIFLLGASILTMGYFSSKSAVRTLSTSLIEQTIDRMEVELREFFASVTGELKIARAWGESGLLDINNPGRLNLLFAPIIEDHPQISSFLLANSAGDEYMLQRAGNKWVNRQTKPGVWKGASKQLEWKGQGAPVTSWKNLHYDPRGRAWYKGAIKDGLGSGVVAYWTSPYMFFTTNEPGLTASTVYKGRDGLQHVIGFDILLNDISSFTTKLNVSKHGKVLVLTDDFRVVGLPRDRRFTNGEDRKSLLLKKVNKLDMAVTSDAILAFKRQSSGKDGAVIRFMSADEPWWGASRPFRLSTERLLWVYVLVPESDLLGTISDTRGWIILLTVLVLTLALIRAVAMSQRYSDPIEALAAQSERIRDGDLSPPTKPVRSTLREVVDLASAQESMRTGLKSLLKLEHDLQIAQRIQKRTFPTKMPALEGFEIDAWNKPADRTGGDTYDVIGVKVSEDGSRILSEDNADHAILLLADATGHGIGPALSISEVRAMLRMAVRTGETLRGICTHINNQLISDLYEGRFVTAWIAHLDVRESMLTCFSAGQAPLLRYTASLDRFDILSADASPFGISSAMVIETNNMKMEKGDIFAVISDGIFEATNRDGERFGTERTIDALSQIRASSPSRMIQALVERVNDFTDALPAKDDRTILIVKCV